MKILFVLLIAPFLHLFAHEEKEINQLTHYQINPFEESISLEVENFSLSYDDIGNPRLKKIRTRNLKIASQSVDLDNFGSSENIDVLSSIEDEDKTIYELNIDGSSYIAYENKASSSLTHSSLFIGDADQAIKVKVMGDWRTGIPTTYFQWKGKQFSAYDVSTIKNGMTLRLVDVSIRSPTSYYYYFSTEDGFVFIAV